MKDCISIRKSMEGLKIEIQSFFLSTRLLKKMQDHTLSLKVYHKVFGFA